jgi:hypothetical protein
MRPLEEAVFRICWPRRRKCEKLLRYSRYIVSTQFFPFWAAYGGMEELFLRSTKASLVSFTCPTFRNHADDTSMDELLLHGPPVRRARKGAQSLLSPSPRWTFSVNFLLNPSFKFQHALLSRTRRERRCGRAASSRTPTTTPRGGAQSLQLPSPSWTSPSPSWTYSVNLLVVLPSKLQHFLQLSSLAPAADGRPQEPLLHVHPLQHARGGAQNPRPRGGRLRAARGAGTREAAPDAG